MWKACMFSILYSEFSNQYTEHEILITIAYETTTFRTISNQVA